MPTDLLVGLKLFGFFGAILWFAWRQAKRMESAVAEDKRRAVAAPEAPRAEPGVRNDV